MLTDETEHNAAAAGVILTTCGRDTNTAKASPLRWSHEPVTQSATGTTGAVMAKDFVFTSESVSEGHPDKMADQVSDAVLDAILAQDPDGKVACETLLTKNIAVVAGELRTHAKIDPVAIVRRTAEQIGYTDTACGFDAKSCEVRTYLGGQSADIAMGVDHADGEIGAGDQGLMFGYATDETP